MSQAMVSLGRICADRKSFSDILHEIRAAHGCRSINCALSGAVMGCEIGYKNLPEDLMLMINTDDRKYLDEQITAHVKMLCLIPRTAVSFMDTEVDSEVGEVDSEVGEVDCEATTPQT